MVYRGHSISWCPTEHQQEKVSVLLRPPRKLRDGGGESYSFRETLRVSAVCKKEDGMVFAGTCRMHAAVEGKRSLRIAVSQVSWLELAIFARIHYCENVYVSWWLPAIPLAF